jgi:YD repeat-containing protein
MAPTYRVSKAFRSETNAFGSSGAESYLYSESTLDERGNLLKTVTYSDDGSVFETVENSYDDKNRLVGETIIQHGDNQTQKKVLEYRENPQMVIERTIYSDGGESRIESTFSADGRVEKIEQFIDGTEPDSTELFNYDADNRLISYITKDSGGNVMREDALSYTDAERTIVHTDEDGSVTEEVHHTDSRGLITRTDHCQDDSIFAYEDHEYDANGRLIKTLCFELGKLISERHFAFDENGNRILEEVQDHRYRRIQKTSRSFDDAGRVTQEEHFSTYGASESYTLTFQYE